MECEICGRGPQASKGGVTVYRESPKGVSPARWRCYAHRSQEPDRGVKDLVDILEEGKDTST